MRVASICLPSVVRYLESGEVIVGAEAQKAAEVLTYKILLPQQNVYLGVRLVRSKPCRSTSLLNSLKQRAVFRRFKLALEM